MQLAQWKMKNPGNLNKGNVGEARNPPDGFSEQHQGVWIGPRLVGRWVARSVGRAVARSLARSPEGTGTHEAYKAAKPAQNTENNIKYQFLF